MRSEQVSEDRAPEQALDSFGNSHTMESHFPAWSNGKATMHTMPWYLKMEFARQFDK